MPPPLLAPLKRLPGSKYYSDAYAAYLFALAERYCIDSTVALPEEVASNLSPDWFPLYLRQREFQSKGVREEELIWGWFRLIANENPQGIPARIELMGDALEEAMAALEAWEANKEESPARVDIEGAAEELRQGWGCLFGWDEELETTCFDFQGPIYSEESGSKIWTMAEVRPSVDKDRWGWQGWLQRGQWCVLAGEPGAGKSFVALDLAKRFYLGLPLPDGSPSPFPLHTQSIWIPTDRNPDELADRMRAQGIPDEAIVFNGLKEPFDSLLLDDEGAVRRLGELAKAIRPALVVIDTIGRATRKPMTRPEDAAGFFDPLLDSVAIPASTSLLALTHLNKNGEVIDRRIEGVCRVEIRLSLPDSKQPHRRRLEVTKSNNAYPPALACEFSDEGASYDVDAPSSSKPGRKGDASEKAVAFLQAALERGPRESAALKAEAQAQGISPATLQRAREGAGVKAQGKLWGINP